MASHPDLPPGLLLQNFVPAPEWPCRALRICRAAAILLLILSGLPAMYFCSFLKWARLAQPRTIANVRVHGTAFWLRGILCAMGVRVKIQGQIPRGGALILPNHQSYMDILVLLSRLPSVFVSNAGVRHWPFFGHLTANLGTLYIDRARRRMVKYVMPMVENHLRWGVKVVIFLETTTTDGSKLLAFRPGFLEAALSTGSCCLPITIQYSTPHDAAPTASTVNWWGGMKFFPHLWRLLALRTIHVNIRLGEPLAPQPEMNRKVLSDQLFAQMSSTLFGNLYPKDPVVMD